MIPAADVVVIGGGVIGASVAHYLTAAQAGRVVVVERDPTYATASTGLSASGIRTQFSNALNVQISLYGMQVIRDWPDLMAADGARPDLQFQPGGYLFLAGNAAQAEILRANHAVQTACGADVVLWQPAQLAEAFPHLNTSDITLGSYGRSGEGWFDNMGMLNGFRAKARAAGADFVHGEVVRITRQGARLTEVLLASGERIAAGHVVNAAGPRAAQVAAMAGLALPVEPRKRTVFVFGCASPPKATRLLPLMVDVGGVYVRPEGRYFLCGVSPPDDPEVALDDFDPRYHEFEEIIWPALAHRAPAFEAIKVVTQWAGHYAMNVLDHNMVIGAHPDVENLIFANGFSGHGLQQAPATGRAVAELICHGAFQTLDLAPLGWARVLEERPFYERAVV